MSQGNEKKDEKKKQIQNMAIEGEKHIDTPILLPNLGLSTVIRTLIL